ncbi:hypothetical protein [Longispora albida]|uniref:hypothetical protein n=1 Tax=Longispora albida TaxID=203523 RepID=UPI0012FB2CFF|nr:hypothetical protein [Longispora albida]
MSLKRVVPSIAHRKYDYAKLWQDDLGHIVADLRDLGSPLVLRADDYELDDVSDLDSLPQLRLESFTVRSVDGRVRLELSRSEAWIEISEPDTLAYGVLARIGGTFTARSRNLPWLGLGCLALIWLIASVILLYALDDGRGIGAATGFALFVAPVGVLFLIGLAFERGTWIIRRTILVTRRRADAPGFLERNRDSLWITIVSSFASLIIGGMLGYYINQIS